jgi:drug/metabolite transporter superfamily protein YnfA
MILLWYVLAAAGESAGCFAFWLWLRLHKTPLWIIPGTVSLILLAIALTRVDAAAGRVYAAYGGHLYIVVSALFVGSRGHETGSVGCSDERRSFSSDRAPLRRTPPQRAAFCARPT